MRESDENSNGDVNEHLLGLYDIFFDGRGLTWLKDFDGLVGMDSHSMGRIVSLLRKIIFMYRETYSEEHMMLLSGSIVRFLIQRTLQYCIFTMGVIVFLAMHVASMIQCEERGLKLLCTKKHRTCICL